MSISITPPPAPPKKKSRLGCLGCGCLIMALLVAIFLALLSVGGYFTYQKGYALTSTKPEPFPTFDGGDNFYADLRQKLAGFDHDLKDQQAATVQLSGDEINTLIGRDPYMIEHKIHLFVSLKNNVAQVQGSMPTDTFIQAFFAGRYINFTASFTLDFNPGTKTLTPMLQSLKLGDQITPANLLPAMQAEFGPLLNMQMKNNPDCKRLLDQAKSIQIKNGQVVIETQ